jgi:2-aminoethylphosphonate dioxygenase
MRFEHSIAESFRLSGWAVVPGLLTSEERRVVRTWADGIENDPGEGWLKYYELSSDGRKVLSRIENFVQPRSSLAFLVQPSAALIELVSTFFEDQAVLFKDKVNLKPSGGGAYATHQDGPAYSGFGISDFITAMLAIDDATVLNGCLEFAIGPRITRQLEIDDAGQIKASEIADLRFEPVPVRPGDAIVFDGLVPHRSSPNTSGSPRRALFLTFNPRAQGDRRSAYYQAKQQVFPPEDQREAGRDYRKSGGQFNLGNPFL